MSSTPLPTRERQRLETRSLILRVALDEIAAKGLAGATIEAIARKAGVTRPTIYAHFPRKEDFLLAFQARTEHGVLQALQRKRVDASIGADLVHRLADAIFDLTEVGDPVLRRESFALIIREPQQMDWGRNLLFGFMAERIAEAQANGELSSELSAPELTRLLVTAFFGFLIVENEPSEARRWDAHRMLDLLIEGATT